MNHLEKEPFEDINVNGARIRLVGTAHVSQASTDFVIEQIEKGSYDCVAVELCASRCQQLIEPEAVENMDLFEIIKKESSRFGRYACHECLSTKNSSKISY